jgi:hypothetical protein
MPSYTVPEAAFYLRLPVSTLRAWIGRQTAFEKVGVASSQLTNGHTIQNLVYDA